MNYWLELNLFRKLDFASLKIWGHYSAPDWRQTKNPRLNSYLWGKICWKIIWAGQPFLKWWLLALCHKNSWESTFFELTTPNACLKNSWNCQIFDIISICGHVFIILHDNLMMCPHFFCQIIAEDWMKHLCYTITLWTIASR